MSGKKKSKGKNSALSEAAAILGKSGGVRGGPARAKALSAEERSAIASKAAKSRWQGESRKHRKPSQKKHENPDSPE